MYTTPTLPNSWIARGADDILYIVPNVPGGWLRKARYNGPMAGLAPVSAKVASALMSILDGDFAWGRSLTVGYIVLD